MEIKYFCSTCKQSFDSELECLNHEVNEHSLSASSLPDGVHLFDLAGDLMDVQSVDEVDWNCLNHFYCDSEESLEELSAILFQHGILNIDGINYRPGDIMEYRVNEGYVNLSKEMRENADFIARLHAQVAKQKAR